MASGKIPFICLTEKSFCDRLIANWMLELMPSAKMLNNKIAIARRMLLAGDALAL